MAFLGLSGPSGKVGLHKGAFLRGLIRGLTKGLIRGPIGAARGGIKEATGGPFRGLIRWAKGSRGPQKGAS